MWRIESKNDEGGWELRGQFRDKHVAELMLAHLACTIRHYDWRRWRVVLAGKAVAA